MTEMDQIPNVEHFALITTKTTNVYHGGDERSRTNPGHGYPAYTEAIKSVEYQAFDSEEALTSYIQRWHKNDANYRVIKATPLRVTTSVVVSVLP